MAKQKESVKFRHHCGDKVNPKFDKHGERNADYHESIRREYEVGDKVQWFPLYASTPTGQRLGLTEQTGRRVAFTSCPDCGEPVTVVTGA